MFIGMLLFCILFDEKNKELYLSYTCTWIYIIVWFCFVGNERWYGWQAEVSTNTDNNKRIVIDVF